MKRDKYKPFELEAKFMEWFKSPMQIIPWQFATFCIVFGLLILMGGNSIGYSAGYNAGVSTHTPTFEVIAEQANVEPMTLSQFGTWLMALIWWALIILLLLMVIR
jgi:hypothetical protein